VPGGALGTARSLDLLRPWFPQQLNTQTPFLANNPRISSLFSPLACELERISKIKYLVLTFFLLFYTYETVTALSPPTATSVIPWITFGTKNGRLVIWPPTSYIGRTFPWPVSVLPKSPEWKVSGSRPTKPAARLAARKQRQDPPCQGRDLTLPAAVIRRTAAEHWTDSTVADGRRNECRKIREDDAVIV
jgi:hypothetical protein